MNIPVFQTAAGVIFPTLDMGNGRMQICIDSSNFEECKNYEKQLAESGFKKHISREIPAGSERAHNTNLFYLYTREDMQIAFTYAAALRKIQIIASPPGPLYAPMEALPHKVVPSITQCTVNGMSYVIQLADGSFVLIDGGVDNEGGGVEELYAVLCDKAPGGEKPVIKMWFFTHPDIDHIGLATDFIHKYGDKIEICGIAYSFPPYIDYAYQSTEQTRAHVAALEESIRINFPETPVHYLYMGDVYRFPGVEAEILWTGDMLHPTIFWTGNDISVAIRFRFENGKTAVFFGDCMHPACQQMALTYGDSLKCDILQVTHHGLIGGDIGAYKLLDPDICFWATAEERFNGQLASDKFNWCIGEGGCDYNKWIRDDSVRVRTHLHKGKLQTVSME